MGISFTILFRQTTYLDVQPGSSKVGRDSVLAISVSIHSALGIALDISKLYVRFWNGGLVLKVARRNSVIAVVKKKPAQTDSLPSKARARARLHILATAF
jgi:hypothetical protein